MGTGGADAAAVGIRVRHAFGERRFNESAEKMSGEEGGGGLA